MNSYLLMFFGGVLGIVLHALVTMQTINKNTSAVNFKTVWKQYWISDYWALIISLAVLSIFVYTISEWIDLNNLEAPTKGESIAERALHFKLSAFIKTSSVIIGYFADYLIYKFIGKAKKEIDKKLSDAGIE